MFNVQILLRLTRIKTYLPTLFSIIGLIFLISPQNIFSYKTIIAFLSNFFLTAFIFVFNDVEDAEDDYRVLEKRKRNPVSNKDITRTEGYLIGLLLVFCGLFLLLTITPLVFFFGILLTLFGFFYSWKPVRLKSIPVIDLISHVIILGVLQFFITYLTFRSLDFLVIPFLMIIIPGSLMVQLFFEFRDFDVDKKTKIKNTTQMLGKFNIKKLLIVLSVIVVIGSGIIIFNIPSEYQLIVLFASIFLGIRAYFWAKNLLKLYY